MKFYDDTNSLILNLTPHLVNLTNLQAAVDLASEKFERYNEEGNTTNELIMLPVSD
jgi:hypothetical protein